MMACQIIHTVSGLEVVWIGHEGCAGRLPPDFVLSWEVS